MSETTRSINVLYHDHSEHPFPFGVRSYDPDNAHVCHLLLDVLHANFMAVSHRLGPMDTLIRQPFVDWTGRLRSWNLPMEGAVVTRDGSKVSVVWEPPLLRRTVEDLDALLDRFAPLAQRVLDGTLPGPKPTYTASQDALTAANEMRDLIWDGKDPEAVRQDRWFCLTAADQDIQFCRPMDGSSLAARDQAVRDALAAGIPALEIMYETDLSRETIDQIRAGHL